ncbi:hypothetical protein [Wukongibacter baidiensis]
MKIRIKVMEKPPLKTTSSKDQNFLKFLEEFTVKHGKMLDKLSK